MYQRRYHGAYRSLDAFEIVPTYIEQVADGGLQFFLSCLALPRWAAAARVETSLIDANS